jgi:hypothetical protein
MELGFALMRDSPSFACPKQGKRTKRHPGMAPAAPVHCDARAEGMRQKLAPLRSPQTFAA